MCGYNIRGVTVRCAKAHSSAGWAGGCHSDMLESSLLHIIICAYCTPSHTALFLRCKNLRNKGWRKEEYCSSFLYFLTPELQVWKKQRAWHLPFINSAETEIQALKLQEWKNTKFITCWHSSWKGECQRQILPVRTECPSVVSGSRSFAAWIR